MKDLKKLTDKLLLANTKSLVADERGILIRLLQHLNEIERRGLYLKLGYSSMYDLLTRGLKFSEGAAMRRLNSARLISKFPEVEAMLANGELSLCTASYAFSKLTEENKAEILPKLLGASKREVERIFVSGVEKKEVKEGIKPIASEPVPKQDKEELPIFKVSSSSTATGGGESEKREIEEPLEVRHEVRFSCSDSFLKKLNRAQLLLSGKYPRGVKLEDCFEACLDLFIEKCCPKKRQERREKRKKTETGVQQVAKISRHIPAKVRDEVFIRDKHQCTYVSEDGVRCECKHNLHVDHIKAFALGGDHKPENLRLLCQAHNLLVAKQVFGEAYIQSRIEAA